jgi:hypothetical protein
LIPLLPEATCVGPALALAIGIIKIPVPLLPEVAGVEGLSLAVDVEIELPVPLLLEVAWLSLAVIEESVESDESVSRGGFGCRSDGTPMPL